jgi:hypothetical protein
VSRLREKLYRFFKIVGYAPQGRRLVYRINPVLWVVAFRDGFFKLFGCNDMHGGGVYTIQV